MNLVAFFVAVVVVLSLATMLVLRSNLWRGERPTGAATDTDAYKREAPPRERVHSDSRPHRIPVASGARRGAGLSTDEDD
jgi:hypothetical protein